MWWLRSVQKKNWEARMGDCVWMWFGECFSPSLVILLHASFPQTHPSAIILCTCLSEADVHFLAVPIGKSPDDGLSYVVNPCFDAEGRWLPRREWPAELR